MVLDGKKIADEILSGLREQVAGLAFKPVFCDVLVGEDPVSSSYVAIKGRVAESIGVSFTCAQYPKNISEADLIEHIQTIQQNPFLCGLIVQLPLPEHLDRQRVLDSIRPELDVDGIGSSNQKSFYEKQEAFLPPTAQAVMTMLDSTGQDFSNKKFLVIGKGLLVGRPVAFLLERRGFTIDTADKSTAGLSDLIGRADIIISGTGQPGLITGDMIQLGCTVIDAGTAESDGGIVGDIDFISVKDKASFISPVPGGVGPVTVASLLSNVVLAARNKK